MFVIFAILAIFFGVAFVMARGDSPGQALLNGAATTLGAIVLVGLTADLTQGSSLPFSVGLFAIAAILIAVAGGFISALIQAENQRLADTEKPFFGFRKKAGRGVSLMIVGLLIIAGGLSGEFVLRGTESTIALAGIGAGMFFVGLLIGVERKALDSSQP